MNNLPTEESFLKDVAEHEMQIMLDNDLYRHIRFSKPNNSNMYFDLITGPNYLLYRGDMGTYEFERLPDMFEFFRTDREYNQKQGVKLSINTGYWAGKCEAASKFGDGVKMFSENKFAKKVRELANEFIEEGGLDEFKIEEGDDPTSDFNDEIEELISGVENPHSAYEALSCYEFSGFDLNAEEVFGEDYREFDFDEYSYHYIWCCYAMAWGIEQYDNFKLESK